MNPSTQPDHRLAAQLRRLLDQATPEAVPGGVLLWWGASDLPSGTGPPTALNQLAWEGTYLRLQNGALADGVVTPLPTVLAATTPRRPDGPLPIAIANFTYAVPRPELADRVRRAAADGRGLEHPPQRLQEHLLERRAFFAAGLLHDQWGFTLPAHRGRTVDFVVREDFHLTNPGAPLPDAVALDVGDGRGFVPVEIGTPVSATFADDAATAQMTIRCTYGSEILTAAFSVALSDQPAAPEPDEIWSLRGECGNTGSAYVYLADGHAMVKRPVIMVEGFPGGHAADYLYDTFDQQKTAGKLRAAGRDLVIVGLDQGSDEIQRNADVLVACIRNALRRTDEPLVVGGVSMGGLVSRFALTAMEHRHERHNTELFLTIDTPHGGAYTSLGAQWFVQTFRSILPALEAEAQLLDSAANQQFVLQWVRNGVAEASPLRTAFIDELQRLGNYPQSPRRLAVACGRGDGVSGTPAGTQTLSWDGQPWISAELRTLAAAGPEVVGQGSWLLAEPPQLPPLRFDSRGRPWEGAPGGQDVYNGQAAAIAGGVGCGAVTHMFDVTCAVPTVSALDLDRDLDPFAAVPSAGSDKSPFHDYIYNSENQLHLTITPECSAWLLAALGVTAEDCEEATRV